MNGRKAPPRSAVEEDDEAAAVPALSNYKMENEFDRHSRPASPSDARLTDNNAHAMQSRNHHHPATPVDAIDAGNYDDRRGSRNSQRPVPLKPHKEQEHGMETPARILSSKRDSRQRNVAEKDKQKKGWLGENLILVLTIAGVVSGVVLGIILKAIENSRGSRISDDWVTIIKFPGELLMRMLKCLIVPLITASLIAGLAQLDLARSAVIGKRALIYYFCTTAIAVVLGIILVLIIHPGDPNIKRDAGEITGNQDLSTLDAFMDLIRNLLPENIVQAAFMTQATRFTPTTFRTKFTDDEQRTFDAAQGYNEHVVDSSGARVPPLQFHSEVRQVRKLIEQFGINMLGLIVFCIAFGTVLTRMGTRGQVVVDFFTVVNDVTMQLVMIVVWYSPIGIASLIAGKIVEVTDLVQMAVILAWYMFTVMLGLAIHALVVLPAIFYATTRKNPFVFMKGMLQAWLMALATASSSATMPFTFHCLEAKNNVDMRVSRFVIPIGATVNMDGTALYEAVAAIFIGQINGMSMSLGKVITVSVTATLASVGAASIPSAGLITMMVVLSSVGLPVQDISMIVAVDWLLDRFRTSVNVLGDAFGAGIVDHLSKKELRDMDKQRDEEGFDAFADLKDENEPNNNNNTAVHHRVHDAKV